MHDLPLHQIENTLQHLRMHGESCRSVFSLRCVSPRLHVETAYSRDDT
jgi:hypothetical protein